MLHSVAVVDDSPEFQQLAKVMFAYLGIDQIQQWVSSPEALPKLKQQPPELLVLDIMMADISGLDVWSELRNYPQTKQLPIVVVTAAINRIVDHEHRLNRDPHTVLLPKPFTLDELRQALGELVPQWQR